MSAGTFTAYQSGLYRLVHRDVDWINDTIKAVLVTAAYTPDAAAHSVIGDVSANEVATANYARVALTNKTVTKNGSGKTVLDADDVVHGGSNTSFTNARYLILYKDSGVAGTSYLIGYVDLNGADVSTLNAPITTVWNSAGIYQITP